MEEVITNCDKSPPLVYCEGEGWRKLWKKNVLTIFKEINWVKSYEIWSRDGILFAIEKKYISEIFSSDDFLRQTHGPSQNSFSFFFYN